MQTSNIMKRSLHANVLNISDETLNTIQNTLLQYQFESQYFLHIVNKDYLNAVLFLLLYKSSMQTKKIKTGLNKLSEGELKQLKETYFDKDKQLRYLNIAQLCQQTSGTFSYNQQLIKKSAGIFQTLAVNYLFDHQDYRNKIRIRQFRDNSLVAFNNIAFSQGKVIAKNDIVLIPHEQGYFLAFYSSELYHFKENIHSNTTKIYKLSPSKTEEEKKAQAQQIPLFSSNAQQKEKMLGEDENGIQQKQVQQNGTIDIQEQQNKSSQQAPQKITKDSLFNFYWLIVVLLIAIGFIFLSTK